MGNRIVETLLEFIQTSKVLNTLLLCPSVFVIGFIKIKAGDPFNGN